MPQDRTKISAFFENSLKELGVSVLPDVQEKMLDFLAFLQKWNKAYNLTAITDLDEMLRQHLLDSLTVLPYLKAARVLDVGSGAGFPGIPLALCLPDVGFTLLDTNGKKTRFLLQAATLLEMSNVEVVQQRMENYRPDQGFDVIICRAVGAMADIVAATRPALAPGGAWLFMKGQYPDAELESVLYPSEVHRLTVPGTSVQRHLVVIKKNESIKK